MSLVVECLFTAEEVIVIALLDESVRARTSIAEHKLRIFRHQSCLEFSIEISIGSSYIHNVEGTIRPQFAKHITAYPTR